jgi:hypothetical protein
LSPGVKFKDADLLGMPLRLTVGAKGLKDGIVELRDRRTKEVLKMKPEECGDRRWRLEIGRCREAWRTSQSQSANADFFFPKRQAMAMLST